MDVAEIVQWYEEQSPSLGLRFWMEFKGLVRRVTRFPDIYPPFGRRGVRKAPMATFPHRVYYRLVANELRVLGVIHPARDPKFIRGRIH